MKKIEKQIKDLEIGMIVLFVIIIIIGIAFAFHNNNNIKTENIGIIEPPLLKEDNCDCFYEELALNLTYKMFESCVIDLGMCCENLTKQEVLDYLYKK